MERLLCIVAQVVGILETNATWNKREVERKGGDVHVTITVKRTRAQLNPSKRQTLAGVTPGANQVQLCETPEVGCYIEGRGRDLHG